MESCPVSRADVASLLASRSPKPLTQGQLSVKATNLLQAMREEGLISKCGGSTKSALYRYQGGKRSRPRRLGIGISAAGPCRV